MTTLIGTLESARQILNDLEKRLNAKCHDIDIEDLEYDTIDDIFNTFIIYLDAINNDRESLFISCLIDWYYESEDTFKEYWNSVNRNVEQTFMNSDDFTYRAIETENGVIVIKEDT